MSHHYTVQDDMLEICLNNHKDFLPSSLKSLLNSPSILNIVHSFDDVMVKVFQESDLQAVTKLCKIEKGCPEYIL